MFPRQIANTPFEIVIQELIPWVFEGPIFFDDFETGDFSAWDTINDGSGGEEDAPSEEEQAIIDHERQQDALVDTEVELLEELGLLPESSDDQ